MKFAVGGAGRPDLPLGWGLGHWALGFRLLALGFKLWALGFGHFNLSENKDNYKGTLL